MRVIDAVWEKRNLGVETKEIEFEEADGLEDVKKCLKDIHGEYMVAKIPTSRADITHLLYEYQFEYMEDLILFVSDLEIVNKSRAMERLYDAVLVKRAEKEDIEEIYTEIRKGMFSTDRISLDEHFSKEVAAERYANWTMDELERGTELYNYVYKGKNVGFFGLREIKDGVYTSFLGGIYNRYRLGGIGTVSMLKILERIKELGGKQLHSMVSSNNIGQVKNLIYIGYYVSKISHVFVKHER